MSPTHFNHSRICACKLSPEEQANPLLVIHSFLDYAHLPELRQVLWEWMKTTVTGNFNTTLAESERVRIVFLYEQIDKLVEGIHLLYPDDIRMESRTDLPEPLF